MVLMQWDLFPEVKGESTTVVFIDAAPALVHQYGPSHG